MVEPALRVLIDEARNHVHPNVVVNPTVAIVGGEDVTARIPIMEKLRDSYDFVALGTRPGLATIFEEAGFAYHDYSMGRQVTPLSDLRSVVELRSIFKLIEPDLVHTFDTKPSVWGRMAARWAGVPNVIGTIPGLGRLYVERGILTAASRKVYEALQQVTSHMADLTIFQNQHDRDELVSKGVVPCARSAVVLGSGVDTQFYDPTRFTAKDKFQTRLELGVPQNAILFTLVTRVIRSKGVMEFARAAATLKRRVPQTDCVLVGPVDTEVPDRLENTELEILKDTLHFRGARSDIDRVLYASDVFVLPTRYREGVPRVLLEAAAMEIPLIAHDVPGCREIVKHGETGLLVQDDSNGSLLASMAKLAVDAEYRARLALGVRQRAVRYFDLNLIAEETRQVYERLLDPLGQGYR